MSRPLIPNPTTAHCAVTRELTLGRGVFNTIRDLAQLWVKAKGAMCASEAGNLG
jgi:hypothetical protein